MDIERMTDEQISEYIKLRQQENPSDYSYQPKGPSESGVMGTALVELDKNGNPRKSKQYLNSITPKLGTTEIDTEIERLTALKEQNNQAQATESNKPADGIYNPADYIGQIANKMNNQSRNRGDQFSKSLEVIKDAGRRTGFEQDTDGTPLPETAYDWVVQQVNAARARGPVSKYTLKAIENGAKVRYNVPTNFNISGPSGIVGFLNGSTERNMAKAINSMPYTGNPQKPAQPAQTPQNQQPVQSVETKTEPANKPVQNMDKLEQKPAQAQDVSPKTKLDDARTAAYKRIKSKQASDADLAMFKGYTEEQLKNIGFGPVSIAAIKDVAGIQSQQTSNGLTDEEKQFIQQYNKAANSRKPKDRAFLTPENVKRYNDLIKKQNAIKKRTKI